MTIADDFLADWQNARALFPIMHKAPVVETFDPNIMPLGADGYYRGMYDAAGFYHPWPFVGIPHFMFDPSYTPSPPVTATHRFRHEMGHYLEDRLENDPKIVSGRSVTDCTEWFRAPYWSTRAWVPPAPATWQQANPAPYQWGEDPHESIAESFVGAVAGYFEQERTDNYTHPGDAIALRRFWLAKMNETGDWTFMSKYISPDLAIALDASGNAIITTPIPASAGFVSGLAAACDAKRIGLAGTEAYLPIVMPSIGEDTTKGVTADGRFYVRSVIRGDPVRPGTGYLKVSAWQ